MSDTNMIAALISLNGGEIVGKTRLQKTVYLLDLCGLNSGFDFEYHNFGPFSADLARTINFAELEDLIDVEERPGFHEVPYSVFRTDVEVGKKVGDLTTATIKNLLKTLGQYTAIDLELAATIAFLKEDGVSDELIDRTVHDLKPLKATPERLLRAHDLLRGLELSWD